MIDISKLHLSETPLAHISEIPWSDYTAADYTVEQWHAACLIHQHDGPPTSKGQCKLPVKTPNGAVNRNGVHAAAGALAGARGGVNASEEEKASAARALARLYAQLDEEPPASLLKHSDQDILEHFGTKGMKWGVRKKYTDYQESVYNSTLGSVKTAVIAKTGEKISVVKEKPGPLVLAVGKLTGRPPADYISTMNIHDSAGKKVGSFQIWKEDQSTVRGEWLTIKKDSQGRGYSKAAIEGLIIAAKQDKNLKEVRLQVPTKAAPAKHIYTQLGFKKDKDLGDDPVYGGLEDWVYKINAKPKERR